MIFFDVGSHDGHAFLTTQHDTGDRFRADLHPDLRVFAFEPQPDLFEAIGKRTAALGLTNVMRIGAAVTEANGGQDFHICPDAGCSSLLPFSANVEETWQVKHPSWGYERVPGSGEFRSLRHTETIVVPTIRLDAFIGQYLSDAPPIDYLHVDTQGSDLAVLRSLGKYLPLVQAGVLEVPARPDLALYAGQHTKAEALAFLAACGFEIDEIYCNDPFGLEENVRFSRG